MTPVVEIHRAIDGTTAPDDDSLVRAVAAAVEQASQAGRGFDEPRSVSLAIVDASTSEQLNTEWRQKAGPTNVLAFPAPDFPVGVEDDGDRVSAGDIVICADVVEAEARAQDKSVGDHWLHMVVHGMLHLMGYDHIECQQADEMEALERAALATLGVRDPYREHVA